MIYPFLNLKNLQDDELFQRYGDLQKKYMMTTNANLQIQMQMLLEDFQEEIKDRQKSKNLDLDTLVKIQ